MKKKKKKFLVTYIDKGYTTLHFVNKIFENFMTKEDVYNEILNKPQIIGVINRDIVITNIIEL